jgi:hypothetical protein
MDKWEFAQKMVKDGATNALIMAAVQSKFGTGISTSKLADWRNPTRQVRPRKSAASKKQTRQEMREAKWGYIRECLIKVPDESFHSIQKKTKKKFGEGSGYETIRAIQEELKTEPDITPVEIPEEVRDLGEPSTALAVPALSPPPNGSMSDLKAVQAWMKKIHAKELSLTAEGDLEVLVCHCFNLGNTE